jgi:3-dehydroquinate dehydratase
MLVVFSKVSSAETFIINPDDSIQNTINSANAGDIILLNSGTYNITGISVNKALTIAGKPYFDTNDKIKISELYLMQPVILDPKIL